MNFSSRCKKCGEIFSYTTDDMTEGQEAFDRLMSWQKEHEHLYPRATEPAKRPKREKENGSSKAV